ncbi:VOC family protein [Antrihabitans sp. YC2-6]|uniref:VOC family protein n=1 Tax=Antrihabitans sp. YC2-6 TaxID=2799498 RepID=UPI0018F2F313|nr:VOC family protein [Antrihabitans sp. YC2-6]MBJ8347589.1 VOC family protein [Antrihabitans sp. YC2-6]
MNGDSPIRWTHVFIDVPEPAAALTFWSAVTSWRVGTPWQGLPEFISLIPAQGDSYVHVQRIAGPPRVHFDLAVDDIDTECARLAELGASVGERHEHWQTMASPGGLPFCLCRFRGEQLPAPIEWAGGHRSRIKQVCIDVPAALIDVEWRFWQQTTQWRPRASTTPEFSHLIPPNRQSLQILVQRLGDDDAGSSTRAHLDLGTDNVAAETERMRALGAPVVDDTHSFTVFRDPVGLAFCATPQSPH